MILEQMSHVKEYFLVCVCVHFYFILAVYYKTKKMGQGRFGQSEN